MLEKQVYPDLKDEKGNPIPPYDVTAHTLSLLMNVEFTTVNKPFEYQTPKKRFWNADSGHGCGTQPSVKICDL